MRLFVVLGAALAALGVWAIAQGLAGADLAVRAGTAVAAVGPVAVLVASLAAGFAGWLLRVLLDRIARGRLVWTVVASATFIVSLLGPLSGVDGQSRAGLALLHLTVAAVLIPGLARPAGTSAAGSRTRSGAREAA
jgi:Family of unknown function (DUF6069)